MPEQSKGLLDIRSLLADADGAITKLLLEDPNNRAEAKSWLINTIACLHHDKLPRNARANCFNPCSAANSTAAQDSSRRYSNSRYATDRYSSEQEQHRSRSNSLQDRVYAGSRQQQPAEQQSSAIASCKQAVLQLLSLLCDSEPAAVAALLSKDQHFLCRYLTSSATVCCTWFGQFSLSGIQHFKFGARALANYALTHRTDVWQYLVWAGKHDQAPVAVAGKPHYFAELDVDKTLQQLARLCPEFWSSDELLKSCQGGEWLKLDAAQTTQELYRLLHDARSSRHHPMRQLLLSFITDADWTLLCNRLLPLLPEQQLLVFVQQLAGATQQQQQQQLGDVSSHMGDRRSGRHQPQQQQQQLDSIHSWLADQAAFNTAAAAAAKPASATAAATAAAAAAFKASQLSCVQAPPHVLLSQHVHHWTFNQLLLAVALNNHRQQLLSLMRDDEDAAEMLLQLASIGRQLFGGFQTDQQLGTCLPLPAAAAAGGGGTEWACNFSAVQHLFALCTPDRLGSTSSSTGSVLLLQLLLAGWLLRLYLFLAAAAGPGQTQHAMQRLGCSGTVMHLEPEAAVRTAGVATADVQQQQQQQQQQLGAHSRQKSPEVQACPETQAGSQASPDTQTRPDSQVSPDSQTRPDSQASPDGQAGPDNQAALQQQPRQRLRRGAAAAVGVCWCSSSSGDRHSGSGTSSSGDKDCGRRQSKKHDGSSSRRHTLFKRRKIKVKGGKRRKHASAGEAEAEQTHPRKRKRRRSSSSSDSSSGVSSSSMDEARSSALRKSKTRKQSKSRTSMKRKHKHKHKHKKRLRRHRSSSSSSSSGWEDATSMDLDGGGQLLNPADFPSWTAIAAVDAPSLTAFPTAAAGDSEAHPATAAVGCSELHHKQAAAARVASTSSQQHQLQQRQQQQQQLAALLDALRSLSVGGRLWQHPQWCVRLPWTLAGTATSVNGGVTNSSVAADSSTAPAGHGCRSRGGGSTTASLGGGLCITGSTAEVMDAVACYFLWLWMTQLHVTG